MVKFCSFLLLYLTRGVVQSENGIDNCVSTFVNELSDIMSDFHKVTVPVSGVPNKRNRIDNINYNKPWFNDTCKRLYSVYRRALYDFNVCKTPERHAVLLNCKNEYKNTERKLKRRYLFSQGNMLDHLRKQNPKEFYSRFAKKEKYKN